MKYPFETLSNLKTRFKISISEGSKPHVSTGRTTLETHAFQVLVCVSFVALISTLQRPLLDAHPLRDVPHKIRICASPQGILYTSSLSDIKLSNTDIVIQS